MLKCSRGYTLIELIVVIILISLMMTLTIPRFRNAVLSDNLESATRRLINTIKTLRVDSIRERKAYYLRFDLESGRFWVDSSDMNEEAHSIALEKVYSLPDDVHILDIQLKDKGKITTGETAILFSRKGYIQPSAIHLGSDEDKKFTLALSPFLGRIKLFEDYIDFETSD